jgi:hypothetical protein
MYNKKIITLHTALADARAFSYKFEIDKFLIPIHS